MQLTARLLFLTQTQPGQPLLNLQFKDGKMPLKIELSKGQLANLVADGARMLVGESYAK